MSPRERRNRRLSLGMVLIGTVLAWLTMVAPIVVLISWLWERPTGIWMLVSVFLGPFAFMGLWTAIQSASPTIRWPVMQYFGWGAVLMPLTIAGMIATIWMPNQTVGFIVLTAWIGLGLAGVAAATTIAERSLTFDHILLDRPYRLVQLSDVHIGSRSAKFLRRALEQANRHQPDALLLTGDFIDASAVNSEDLNALQEVSCPVYFSIGNHERYIDLDAVISMTESQGVELLRGQAKTLGKLQIIGIDDADDPHHVGACLPDIDLSEHHYRILLYHRPDGWHAARQAGIDLMLAGHTHGGQIWPFNHVVRQRFRYLVGLFSEEGRHLYVSPGTGCWGPVMRLGTRSEMTVIDLVPALAER